MKKNYVFSSVVMLSLAFLTTPTLTAQNIGINANGAAPDAGAMLDISSTNKGLLIPRVNITNLNNIAPITGSATVSMLVYNTNATTGQGYYYWNGAKWVRLSTGDAWQLTGNAGTNATNNFLGTTDNIDFSIRRANLERFRLNASSVVFNENSYNYDFRVESDNQANIFFIDGGLDRIGIRTNTPANMLQMTNGGVNVGANAMASFDNLGIDGVSLSGYNQSTTSGYNAIEGITNYSGTAYSPAGVFGLAINGSLTHRAIGVRGAANGRDGIGVMGSIQVSQAPSIRAYGWAGYFAGDVFTSGGFYSPSDSKFKKNISPMQNGILTIMELNPVTYDFDIEKYPNIGFSNKTEIGFIAQELKKVVPNAVSEKNIAINATKSLTSTNASSIEYQKFLAVDYTKLIPITVQAIKEQQTIIEAQNAKIEALEKMVLELQKAIENK